MKRLTDDKAAEDLRNVIQNSNEPDIGYERYVKLADYEQTGYEPQEIKRLINPDKLYNDVLDCKCKICYYRGFHRCHNIDNCVISLFLGMIDGERWYRESEETRKHYTQITREELNV